MCSLSERNLVIVMSYLRQEQIDEFRRRGVLVVPNVLSANEINEARDGLHKTLGEYGCNVNTLHDASTQRALKKLSSTNGAGGILDIFYVDFKLKLNQHPLVYQVLTELWAATYGQYHTKDSSVEGQGSDPQDETFIHPYGEFDPQKGYMYVDRVCFRLPDSLPISTTTDRNATGTVPSSSTKPIHRSLTPHLDCCPYDMFTGRKWRPIQCFVPLTDTVNANEGGFEACPGHHIGFDEWAKQRPPSNPLPKETPGSEVRSFNGVPCVGQFTPIRPKEDVDVIERMEHIPCHAGDLVLWDVRIPHANAAHNLTSHPREVVYLGFLPDVPINRSYAADQLARYKEGKVPIDQWHKCTSLQKNTFEFSELGLKLINLQSWDS